MESSLPGRILFWEVDVFRSATLLTEDHFSLGRSLMLSLTVENLFLYTLRPC
jgi:hypothetical protein